MNPRGAVCSGIGLIAVGWTGGEAENEGRERLFVRGGGRIGGLGTREEEGERESGEGEDGEAGAANGQGERVAGKSKTQAQGPRRENGKDGEERERCFPGRAGR